MPSLFPARNVSIGGLYRKSTLVRHDSQLNYEGFISPLHDLSCGPSGDTNTQWLRWPPRPPDSAATWERAESCDSKSVDIVFILGRLLIGINQVVYWWYQQYGVNFLSFHEFFTGHRVVFIDVSVMYWLIFWLCIGCSLGQCYCRLWLCSSLSGDFEITILCKTFGTFCNNSDLNSPKCWQESRGKSTVLGM